jgi:ABC-type arginine transport system permease subunit
MDSRLWYHLRRRLFSCLSILLVAALPAASAFAAAAPAGRGPNADPTASSAPVLVVEDLGKGTVALDGPWQFHLGDDPAWALPAADDATGHNGWAQLTADKPWGAQGHRSYAGYGWYRRHLRLSSAVGASPEFSMLVSHIGDVYEIYWNGARVGGNGKMPPDPSYRGAQPPQIFNLGQAREGVLAVRVWKAPLYSFETGIEGGLYAPPLVGSPASIGDRATSLNYSWLHGRQYEFGLNSLYGLVMVLSLLAWLRDRSQRLLLWMSLYCLAPLLLLFLNDLRLPWSYAVALGWIQPVHALADVSQWFLLLWLLRLTDNRRLVRLTWVFAVVDITANVLDGALTMLDWSNALVQHWAVPADAFFTVFETLPELLPLVLVIYGLRQKLDSSRWLVAFFAFSTSFITSVRIALSQGSRYTHWTIAAKINAPLFHINGNAFNLITLANTGLLLSIIYAVYRYMLESSERQGAMEQELRSAQELQQVLIPDALPSLPGYSVTSAYQPAQEVGGDFFQVIPTKAGSTLLVLGDVSGKGLRAAMTVSLIVGSLRTLAEFYPQPADILAGLNRRLCGRLHGGFTTCLVLRLDPDGACVLANAGHPSPFLNQQEIEMPGALPLGVVADSLYEERSIQLQPGDHFVLYTDGLLEARTPTGELFSFTRLQSLIEDRPSAEQALKVATDFGQEDDITILTLTRLALGETSSTLLSAPALTPA